MAAGERLSDPLKARLEELRRAKGPPVSKRQRPRAEQVAGSPNTYANVNANTYANVKATFATYADLKAGASDPFKMMLRHLRRKDCLRRAVRFRRGHGAAPGRRQGGGRDRRPRRQATAKASAGGGDPPDDPDDPEADPLGRATRGRLGVDRETVA
jgi:hypothetical protein